MKQSLNNSLRNASGEHDKFVRPSILALNYCITRGGFVHAPCPAVIIYRLAWFARVSTRSLSRATMEIIDMRARLSLSHPRGKIIAEVLAGRVIDFIPSRPRALVNIISR